MFARLRYDSGDWDYNPKVAGNVLDSVVQYTSIPVYPEEIVITADSPELASFPFLFMTGHKLVRFSAKERDGLLEQVQQMAGVQKLVNAMSAHDLPAEIASRSDAQVESMPLAS